MRVFISWSGEYSRKLAEALANWLPDVLQCVEPFVSTINIDKGERWAYKIDKALQSTDFGIACLTQANSTSPWLHYEVGAMSLAVPRRVCPVLFDDLIISDISSSPLSQLQITEFSEEGMLGVLRSMNSVAGDAGLEDWRLVAAHRRCWPELEDAIGKIPKSDSDSAADRGEEPEAVGNSDSAKIDTILSLLTRMNAPKVKRDTSRQTTWNLGTAGIERTTFNDLANAGASPLIPDPASFLRLATVAGFDIDKMSVLDDKLSVKLKGLPTKAEIAKLANFAEINFAPWKIVIENEQ